MTSTSGIDGSIGIDVTANDIIDTISRPTIRNRAPPLPRIETSQGYIYSSEANCSYDGGDSGYGSSVNTPSKADVVPNAATHAENAYAAYTIKKNIFSRKSKLKAFRIVPSEAVSSRFQDLKTLFDEPLYRFLFSNGVPASPVSITLRYLGESEQRARPFLVILCSEKLSKRVKQWVSLPAVKQHCQSDTVADDLPRFEIYVHARPPVLLAVPAVLDGKDISCYVRGQGKDHTSERLCGSLIRLKTGDDILGHATLGGLLKISYGTSWTLYGMTVGHVFGCRDAVSSHQNSLHPPRDLDRPGFDHYSDHSSNESEYSDCDGSSTSISDFEDRYELELDDFEPHAEMYGSSRTLLNGIDSSKYERPENDWQFFGIKSGQSWSDTLSMARSGFDWALLQSHQVAYLQPNQYRTLRGHTVFLKPPSDQSFQAGLGKVVSVISGTEGVKNGSIDCSPASFISPGSTRMVDTYVLSLATGDGLGPGDCGSWVVDAVSGEVYGQVVAADIFNTVYVMPFGPILQEIKTIMRADDITFPTKDDLSSLRHIHNQQVPQSRETPHNPRILSETTFNPNSLTSTTRRQRATSTSSDIIRTSLPTVQQSLLDGHNNNPTTTTTRPRSKTDTRTTVTKIWSHVRQAVHRNPRQQENFDCNVEATNTIGGFPLFTPNSSPQPSLIQPQGQGHDPKSPASDSQESSSVAARRTGCDSGYASWENTPANATDESYVLANEIWDISSLRS